MLRSVLLYIHKNKITLEIYKLHLLILRSARWMYQYRRSHISHITLNIVKEVRNFMLYLFLKYPNIALPFQFI